MRVLVIETERVFCPTVSVPVKPFALRRSDR